MHTKQRQHNVVSGEVFIFLLLILDSVFVRSFIRLLFVVALSSAFFSFVSYRRVKNIIQLSSFVSCASLQL